MRTGTRSRSSWRSISTRSIPRTCSRDAASAVAGGQDAASRSSDPPLRARARAWCATSASTYRCSSGFAPWFVAEAVSQLQLAQLGFDAQSGVEMFFMGRARGDGKSIAGLETAHEQMAIFEAMPMEAQAEYMMSSLEQAHDLPKQVNDMVQAWRRGDTGWFQTEIKSDLGKTRRSISRWWRRATASGFRRSRRCSTMTRIILSSSAPLIWWAGQRDRAAQERRDPRCPALSSLLAVDPACGCSAFHSSIRCSRCAFAAATIPGIASRCVFVSTFW
jgi:hypothetical protein